MAALGWCMDSKHGECIVKYQKFYIGPVGKGRRKRDGVIVLDEWVECDCRCHRPAETKPKKATKRAPRMKK